jgi:glycerophosphoryl diester phosphodiesterase
MKGEDQQEVLVYGHAGSGISDGRFVYAPNTLEAVGYGLNVLDADAVEVDVRFTADTQCVIYHDGFLDGHTEATGCAEMFTLAELNNIDYRGKYKIPSLSEVLEISMAANKNVMLDIKPVNECLGVTVDFNMANIALNKSLADLTESQKGLIVFNCRNYGLVQAISDSAIRKSYETSYVQEAIDAFDPDEIDMLVFDLYHVTAAQAAQMKAAEIPFCLWGIKTRADLLYALELQPDEIISDNIPLTMKMTK